MDKSSCVRGIPSIQNQLRIIPTNQSPRSSPPADPDTLTRHDSHTHDTRHSTLHTGHSTGIATPTQIHRSRRARTHTELLRSHASTCVPPLLPTAQPCNTGPGAETVCSGMEHRPTRGHRPSTLQATPHGLQKVSDSSFGVGARAHISPRRARISPRREIIGRCDAARAPRASRLRGRRRSR